MALSIPAVNRFDLAGIGVAGTREAPTGLFSVGLPDIDWSDCGTLLTGALALAFVGYFESLAAARSMAVKHGYDIPPRVRHHPVGRPIRGGPGHHANQVARSRPSSTTSHARTGAHPPGATATPRARSSRAELMDENEGCASVPVIATAERAAMVVLTTPRRRRTSRSQPAAPAWSASSPDARRHQWPEPADLFLTATDRHATGLRHLPPGSAQLPQWLGNDDARVIGQIMKRGVLRILTLQHGHIGAVEQRP